MSDFTTLEKTTWRLIISPPAEGGWNMALDEALQISVGSHQEKPALRLFSWEPPCVSLGYAQPISDIDLNTLNTFGYGIVRRPTGGRAVLHIDELTYSVIAPDEEPRVKGSIIESYRRLADALLHALHLLGIDAKADNEYVLPQGAQKNAPVCFDVPSNYEIVVGEKKIIGSAQARRHHAVLQHGSLPLYGDITRIVDVMAFPDEAKREKVRARLQEHAVNVSAVLERQISWQTAANAFAQAFSETLNIQLIACQPTEEEVKQAELLHKEKYGTKTWNHHK
jgi:lipoyl(octanoyl) transferase